MKCPHCKKENRIIFRQHWSKRYHEFICGDCKLEFDLVFFKINAQKEVNLMYNKLIEFEYYDEIQQIKQRVDNMDEDQLRARLEELKKK